MLTRYSQSFDYYLSRCSLYILTYAQSVVDYILIVSFQNVKELRTPNGTGWRIRESNP